MSSTLDVLLWAVFVGGGALVLLAQRARIARLQQRTYCARLGES